MKADQYAYRDRRQRKRQFRTLWIVRINAAARGHELSYSRLIDGLNRANIELDRKVLADMAVNDEAAFAALAERAKAARAARHAPLLEPASIRGVESGKGKPPFPFFISSISL